MDDINLGLYPWPWLRSLGLTTNYGLLQCPCLHCGAFLDSFHKLLPPPTYPLSYAGPNLVRTFKKQPKIA